MLQQEDDRLDFPVSSNQEQNDCKELEWCLCVRRQSSIQWGIRLLKIEPAYGLLSNCVKYIKTLGKCDWNSNTLQIKLEIRQEYSCNLLQYA